MQLLLASTTLSPLLTSLGCQGLTFAIQVSQLSEMIKNGTFQAENQVLSTRDGKAIAVGQAALEKFRAIGDRENSVVALNALAAATFSSGHLDEAIAYGHRSATLAQQLSHSSLEAQSLSNLGIIYQASGRYANAVDSYKQALLRLHAAEDSAAISQLQSLLGTAHQALGDYSSAVSAQKASLAMAAALSSPFLEAIAQINLGRLCDEQGDYTTAIAWYEHGIALAQDFDFLGLVAYGLNNSGGTYRQLEYSEVAIAQFQKSLVLAQHMQDRVLQTTVLTNLGIAYEDNQMLSQALENHQASVAISRTIEEPRLLTHLLIDASNNLARTQLRLDALVDAEATLQESLLLLSSLHQGLTEKDKLIILNAQLHTYTLLLQVQVAQGNYIAALETSEQSRTHAFAEIGGEGNDPESPPPLTFQQIQQVAQNLNATLVKYAVISKDDYTIQGIQRDEAEQILVWVITPSGEITFESTYLAELDTRLENQIRQSRVALSAVGRTRNPENIPDNPVSASLQALSASIKLQAVYKRLVAPIADSLPENPDDLVIIIPHKSLSYVPFAALQDREGRYLIERHTICSVPDEPMGILMERFCELRQRGKDKAQALRQAMLKTKNIYPNPLAWATFMLVDNPMPFDAPSNLDPVAVQSSL